MTRFALGLQYTGTRYSGWQRQSHRPMTVQQQLEQALSFVANEEITVTCAGRTDAGVHATSQVVHFNTNAKRPLRAWLLGTNTKLPPDISVQWAHEVNDDFHARFSARHRRYRYIIYNYPQRPGIYQNQVTWHLQPLQLDAMQQAANYLVGEHDFNAYRSVHCQAKHARRNIHFLRLTQQGQLIICDIQANGFLHHMVRNIMGVLLEIGSGLKPPVWAQQVLHSGDRCQGGVTAPASGLYLTEVAYPEDFQLPQVPFQPFFLSPVLL